MARMRWLIPPLLLGAAGGMAVLSASEGPPGAVEMRGGVVDTDPASIAPRAGVVDLHIAQASPKKGGEATRKQVDVNETGEPSLVRWRNVTPKPADNVHLVKPEINADVKEDQKPADRERPGPEAAKVPVAKTMPPIPKAGALAEPFPQEQVGLPVELMRLVVPGDNAQTLEKIALGKQLFFDARLSADGTVACATCHDPDKGFTDHLPTSIGIKKQLGQRNSPTVLNALFMESQFWDGRARTLEDQAKLPITNPIEMGHRSGEDVIAALSKDAGYQAAFQKVFGKPVNFDDLARAIAAYERSQVALDARFDRFLAGESNALTAAERRGWTLFNGKGNCMSCHALNRTQPLGMDGKFHNIGVAAHKQDFTTLAREGLAKAMAGDLEAVDRMALETKFSELGRFLVTKEQHDIGAFKTSTLRNVAVTGPYFHDGSAATLWDVMDHYNKGGEQNPFLDSGIERLGLTEPEIDDLVAFMGALTSSRYEALGKKEIARQQALSKTKRPLRDTAVAMGKNTEKPGVKGPFGDLAPKATAKDPARIGGR